MSVFVLELGNMVYKKRIYVKGCLSNTYHLTSLILYQYTDVYDDYVKTQYDLTMLLRNSGGSGLICIVVDML